MLTQGGIYGTVVTLKGDVVMVKIADNVKVEVSRAAITQVIVEASNGSSQPLRKRSSVESNPSRPLEYAGARWDLASISSSRPSPGIVCPSVSVWIASRIKIRSSSKF